MAKKTPTARVIAAKALLTRIDSVGCMTAEDFSGVLDSRVAEKKRGKIVEHADKLARTLRKRLARMVDKYINPPPPNPERVAKAATAFGKKTPPTEPPAAGVPVDAS